MSEVMRWKLKGFIPGVEGVSKALFQPWVVPAEDFDRVTGERDAALAELSRANEKIDKAWNRTTAIDHKGFIPGALDAWKRPVPQHLPYDFSGSTSASTIQYCNGWNDSGSYWSAHAAELGRRVDALQQRLTAADERADVLEAVSVKQAALLDELGIPLDEVDDLFGETLKNAKRYEYLRSVMAVENFPTPHPEWSEPSEAESKRIDDLCDAALNPAEGGGDEQ